MAPRAWRPNHHAGATSCTMSSNGGRHHAPAREMTMFNITDGNNNISRETSPLSTSTWSLASTCLPALPALPRRAFDGTLRSTSPSRCSCSSALCCRRQTVSAECAYGAEVRQRFPGEGGFNSFRRRETEDQAHRARHDERVPGENVPSRCVNQYEKSVKCTHLDF